MGDTFSQFTSNGFVIDKILEPLPTKEFETADPKHYKELMSFPAFLCIRAKKKLKPNSIVSFETMTVLIF